MFKNNYGYPPATWRDRLLPIMTALVVAIEVAFCLVPVFV